MTFREMMVDDLDQVMEIEEDVFAVPWTKEGFLTWMMKDASMFFVVEEKGRILGFCSMMTVMDEGDILNVAVRRDRQREGIGCFLVDSMLRMAGMQGIRTATRRREDCISVLDSGRTASGKIIIQSRWKRLSL